MQPLILACKFSKYMQKFYELIYEFILVVLQLRICFFKKEK